jgi:hypothetical protein
MERKMDNNKNISAKEIRPDGAIYNKFGVIQWEEWPVGASMIVHMVQYYNAVNHHQDKKWSYEKLPDNKCKLTRIE